MLKKIFRSYSRKLPSARGQAMVVFALLTPLLILFVGVGMDLGWYYLNVSRLQNAADAAALAGAYKLVEQDNFSNYFVKALTSPPNDIGEYYEIKINDDETTQLNKTDGEEVAKLYSGKNLGHIVAGKSEENSSTAIFDDWNTSADTARHEVELTSALYAKVTDAQWDENGIRYYGVTLKEEVAHLFLRGFDPMDATVAAYVMLRPHSVDLITRIKELEDTEVIANWQYQNTYKDFDGNWNHYRQTVNGKKAVSYVAGKYFRTETVNIEVQKGDGDNNGFNGTNNHSSGQSTGANGNKYYSEMDVDSLNIDFNQDIATQFSTDWDLGAPTNKKLSYVAAAKDGWDENDGYDLRIQGLINIRDAWKNRNLMDDDTSNDLIPDPLWVRIESDPWWSTKAILPWLTSNTSSEGWNSVRQMIISIDKSNTESTDQAFKFKNNNKKVVNNFADGDFNGYEIKGGLAYKYRPFFIFYKGPEVYDEKNTVRQSQPVILNLNADWNGILYAPNSPVVILGNGKKLTGFVVAKEFVQLATKKDYKDNGYSEYQDLNGKTIIVKSDEVFTENKLTTEYPATDYKITKSEDGKTISVYELKKLPKYFIVEAQYVKEMSGYNDNNYVAALKKYREVTDDDIVEIKFPDKDYFGAENNHQIYHVVAADLLDESNLPNGELAKQTDKSKFVQAEYAPVIVVSTNETKYILKKNLPYVRMYIWKDNQDKYPYVPVCDLKVAKNFPSNIYSTNGATLADDTNNIYNKQHVTTEYKDTESTLLVDEADKNWKVQDLWKVVAVKSNWWNYYDSNADPAKITKTDDNGMKYFISIAEETEVTNYNNNPTIVTATYDKVSDDVYVKSGLKYYTYYEYHTNQDKIDGNKQNIIKLVMDNKGNVQTKALDADPPPYFKVYDVKDTYEFQPHDKGWNKKINDPKTWEKNKDYRIPEYEVVYYKSAFNLSEDSCYSYFQIPSLRRENYEYMNVDELNHIPAPDFSEWSIEDMFFTTRRANWID